MTIRQQLRWILGLLIVIVLAGTVGYIIIEGLNVIDALYLTIITISTVGFGEPPGGFSGAGRAFTILLIVSGVGAGVIAGAAALEVLLDQLVGGNRRQRREGRMIAKLENHTIVCGFGRVGTGVVQRLAKENVEMVVIDAEETLIETGRALGFATIVGDATNENVLEAAGIDRAGALIACVRRDSENLSIVLSSRARRPDLYILGRASRLQAERRLKMAGADRVITPLEVGAERLAALVLHPGLTEFVDIAAGGKMLQFRVEELTVGGRSKVAGKQLSDSRIRTKVGVTVLAIRHPDGSVTTNPSPSSRLKGGDVLVAIGTSDQLRGLEKLV